MGNRDPEKVIQGNSLNQITVTQLIKRKSTIFLHILKGKYNFLDSC